MKAKLIKIVGGIVLGVALLVLALPTIVHKAGLHPEYNGEAVQLPAGKRALIIATNQAVLSAPGETTGDATSIKTARPCMTLASGGRTVCGYLPVRFSDN